MMGHPGMVEEMLGASAGRQAPGAGAFQGRMTPTKLSVPPEDQAQLQEIVRQADQLPYGAAPQQPGGPGYGAPQQPYGSPPQQGGPGYGAPQQPYGSPPQQHGGPQQPYGSAPQQGGPGYGGPQQPYGSPPQQGGPMHGGPMQGGPMHGGPVHGGPMHGGPMHGGPVQGGPMPYGGAPRGASPLSGANFGIQDAHFGAAAHQHQPYGSPGDQAYREALTEQVKPLRAPGHIGQVAEWDESLTTQMLVFGVLLVACFVAPWSVGGGNTTFAWSNLSAEGIPLAQKILPILLAATGVISVAMGAIKLSAMSRAFAATGIGLAPLVFQIVSGKPFRWQIAVAVLGGVALVSGLILRSRHEDGSVGRILASVGAVAIIALYLIPENGTMPVKMLLDQVANNPGKVKLLPIVGAGIGGFTVGLLPLLLTALAFLVWVPAPGRAGSHVLAWTLIFWGLVSALVTLILGPTIVATLKANLSGLFYLPLAGAAWLTLAAFGIAGVVGNQSDH